MPTTQALNQWVESSVMSGGGSRPYWVRLPSNYDKARPYPVLWLLHGCGGVDNHPPMDKQVGSDAILVRGKGSDGTCWDFGANGKDIPYFDAMVTDVKARFCTDTNRYFSVGYSSGSWLANQLNCLRTNVIRAGGTIAGGNPAGNGNNCMGKSAHMFVHDTNDTSNVISGGISARDRLMRQNGCTAGAQPTPQDPSPCVRYTQGCAAGYPVVWCQTSGQNHNRQDNLAAPAFWKFFQEF